MGISTGVFRWRQRDRFGDKGEYAAPAEQATERKSRAVPVFMVLLAFFVIIRVGVVQRYSVACRVRSPPLRRFCCRWLITGAGIVLAVVRLSFRLLMSAIPKRWRTGFSEEDSAEFAAARAVSVAACGWRRGFVAVALHAAGEG